VDLGISGKVAFVSGGSMGMGRTSAELLAQEGCRVVVAALPRDKATIDETVEAIRAAGGDAIGVSGDLTVRDDVEAAVSEATRAFAAPDIAVVNVNGPPPGSFDGVTDEQFVLAMDQMVMSTVYLCRAVLPHMQAQGWGRIVSLNSVGAKEPPREVPHALVNPSRAAVIALNKTLSNEYAEFGITVNTIGTGFIGTDRMYRGFQVMADNQGRALEEVLGEIEATIPTGRVGKPEEIAATVAFLCSEGAGYVNGELINVDGGFHRTAF
jgi:NAD(P)-dependent dehydrogenase (short-subunit alcohol dehydrogenase family)